ncbi:MAG: 2'-5' RNA ligase family protein [Mycobacteriales bacterium]
MPRINLGVAISVPSPWREELSAWRQQVGDPEGARVPPHVTLLPPTQVPAARVPDVDRHLEATAEACASFEMHLSGTGTFRPVSDVVFVVVASGIAHCEQLERRVRSGPLARETRFPYHPHVTVAHDIPAVGLDAAYEGLAGFDARFPVTGFTAFEQESGGVWVPRRDFELRGR